MPALSDIPENLLGPSEKTRFIKWLRFKPMPWWDKKELLARWGQLNDIKITADEFVEAKAHPPN